MRPRIATSNVDLRARLASEPRSPCFAGPVSPCYGELCPCYGEIISLLLSCSSCTANFPQVIVFKVNLPAKTGPETANSPRFLPVTREHQGESGRQTPLQPGLDPAEFASQQARMEPRRLEMCECGSLRGGEHCGARRLPVRLHQSDRWPRIKSARGPPRAEGCAHSQSADLTRDVVRRPPARGGLGCANSPGAGCGDSRVGPDPLRREVKP